MDTSIFFLTFLAHNAGFGPQYKFQGLSLIVDVELSAPKLAVQLYLYYLEEEGQSFVLMNGQFISLHIQWAP